MGSYNNSVEVLARWSKYPTEWSTYLHSGLHSLHSGLHSLHSGLHIVNSGQQILHSGLHILHSGLRILHSGLHILHSGQQILHGGLHILHSGLHTLHSGLHIVLIVYICGLAMTARDACNIVSWDKHLAGIKRVTWDENLCDIRTISPREPKKVFQFPLSTSKTKDRSNQFIFKVTQSCKLKTQDQGTLLPSFPLSKKNPARF